MATTGKTAEVFFENVLETIEDQMMMVDLVDRFEPDGGSMQNANNVLWRSVEQQAVILDGWDLTGQETDIIEETYPAILGTPKNDFVEQRADDMRDMQFWERRGKRSGMQQAVELNKTIAQAIATQGSLFYTSAATSGYSFIAEAQALMNEQQRNTTQRNFLLNDRDNLTFGQDLAGRQTVQGRPEQTWKTGQIGQNVAEFNVYTGSFLPTITGGADPATTVTATQSFAPEGGSVDQAAGTVTNVDYRSATIPVAASGSYNVGDKVTFPNVNAIGVSDKTDTGQLRTFTIVAIPDGTSVTVYPKPIAFDDPGLSTLQKAYANVSTRILSGVTMNRVNTSASDRTNLFWDEDAIEVFSGNIPANLFSEYDGFKVISETMSNGQSMYMVYDGNIETMTFRYRLFTWWGVTVRDPQRCGVALTS